MNTMLTDPHFWFGVLLVPGGIFIYSYVVVNRPLWRYKRRLKELKKEQEEYYQYMGYTELWKEVDETLRKYGKRPPKD